MTDSDVPIWLEAARSRARGGRPFEVRDDWPRFPRAGDLRVAEPTAVGRCDPRMVLVIGLDPDTGIADVALVSNETEFASGVDVVMAAANTGLPFDILVETEAVAQIWCVQLGRLVAELGLDLRPTIQRTTAGRMMVTPTARHIRDADPSIDQLALFREREQGELAALTEDCRQALIRQESRPETVLDPAVLGPAAEGARSGTFERWLTIAEVLVQSPSAAIPVAALEASLDVDGLVPRTRPGCPGPDEVRAVLPLVERVLSDRPTVDAVDLEIEPARRRPDRALDRELMSMLVTASRRGMRTVRLLTVPDAWTGEFEESVAMARVTAVDTHRTQIIRHNLEARS